MRLKPDQYRHACIYACSIYIWQECLPGHFLSCPGKARSRFDQPGSQKKWNNEILSGLNLPFPTFSIHENPFLCLTVLC